MKFSDVSIPAAIISGEGGLNRALQQGVGGIAAQQLAKLSAKRKKGMKAGGKVRGCGCAIKGVKKAKVR